MLSPDRKCCAAAGCDCKDDCDSVCDCDNQLDDMSRLQFSPRRDSRTYAPRDPTHNEIRSNFKPFQNLQKSSQNSNVVCRYILCMVDSAASRAMLCSVRCMHPAAKCSLGNKHSAAEV